MKKKDYIRYEIQERKYSSNVVLGIYLVWNEDKKRFDEEKDKLLAPYIKKEDGDTLTKKLVEFLNTQVGKW